MTSLPSPFTTPAHLQITDAVAAIRLLDALDTTHGIGVDSEALEAFTGTVEARYRAP